MQGNRSKNTKPELALRRELHSRGLRYRVDQRPEPDLPTRADIVFRRARIAIYVDGCFWHRCPQHGTTPKANSDYWTPKLDRNVARDHHTNDLLDQRGWTVIRIWEHEDPNHAADRIVAALSPSPCSHGSAIR